MTSPRQTLLRRVPGKTGRRLHLLLQSLPSVHDLLPVYDCLVQPGNTRTSLAANRPAALANTNLLDSAIACHAETARALRTEQSVDTIGVVGQRQPTRTLARERDGQIELLPDEAWEGNGETAYGQGVGGVPPGWATAPYRAAPPSLLNGVVKYAARTRTPAGTSTCPKPGASGTTSKRRSPATSSSASATPSAAGSASTYPTSSQKAPHSQSTPATTATASASPSK